MLDVQPGFSHEHKVPEPCWAYSNKAIECIALTVCTAARVTTQAVACNTQHNSLCLPASPTHPSNTSRGICTRGTVYRLGTPEALSGPSWTATVVGTNPTGLPASCTDESLCQCAAACERCCVSRCCSARNPSCMSASCCSVSASRCCCRPASCCCSWCRCWLSVAVVSHRAVTTLLLRTQRCSSWDHTSGACRGGAWGMGVQGWDGQHHQQ